MLPVKEIGDKKLADITDLQTKNENVVLSNVTVQNNFRIWSLIDRAVGNKAFSEAGEINTRRVYDVAGTPLYAGDLTPCVRADYLLTEIFKDAGFELDATNLLNVIQDYYVPWVDSERLTFAESASDYSLRVRNNSAISSGVTIPYTVFPFDDEIFDSYNLFDPTTYTYTASTNGYYQFKLTTTINNVNKIGGVFFIIRVTDLSAFTSDVVLGGVYTGNGTYSFTSAPFLMTTGYTFQVLYRHTTLITAAP